MRFLELTIQDGFFKRTEKFSKKATLIYSQENSCGKTTFLRALFYSMGYPVPPTKGLKFDRMTFHLTIENQGETFKLFRQNSVLTIGRGKQKTDYSLPSDFHDALKCITDCGNTDVLDNLLGACYLDQEKGWTLLNRGKVIGGIPFNIDGLVQGLGSIDCSEDYGKLKAVEHELKKYRYMLSVSAYQKEISESGSDLEYDTPDEEIARKIQVCRAEKAPLETEYRQIKNILRQNRKLTEFIADMKLMVQAPDGEQIPVTKENLVGYADNTEYLSARQEMLAEEIAKLDRQNDGYEEQADQQGHLFKVQTSLQSFDSRISRIPIDSIAVQQAIDYLEKEREDLKENIRYKTKDNDIVPRLHQVISTYALELGIGPEYVSPSKDYIFTRELKSLSGAVLHKIVFSFRLGYIRLIQEKTGLVLPLVLDSPSGKEVEKETVEKMLKIVQRDFPNHQLIIASIYDYDIKNKKTIEFKGRLFEQ